MLTGADESGRASSEVTAVAWATKSFLASAVSLLRASGVFPVARTNVMRCQQCRPSTWRCAFTLDRMLRHSVYMLARSGLLCRMQASCECSSSSGQRPMAACKYETGQCAAVVTQERHPPASGSQCMYLRRGAGISFSRPAVHTCA